MGMFSRKASASTQSGRPSSDDQLLEMRNKARRRLIGAVVLVLAAIVLIPVLLSDQSANEPEQVVSVIPSIIPPSEEQYRLSERLERPIFEGAAVDELTDQGVIESEADLTLAELPDFIEPPVDLEPEPEPERKKPAPEPKPEPKPAPTPTPQSPKVETRTDDGSVALALLEGRTPPPSRAKAAAVEQGAFVLQIGAYSSKADADQRRSKLVAAGVSNAYVETANVSGKTAYRLRVGPFPSRQAVQAAQTRLRSLGYENSFVSSK